MSNALKSCSSHNNEYVTEDKAMCSSLAEDLDTIAYFLDFQATKDSPMKIQNPVVNFLVLIQLLQFALG